MPNDLEKESIIQKIKRIIKNIFSRKLPVEEKNQIDEIIPQIKEEAEVIKKVRKYKKLKSKKPLRKKTLKKIQKKEIIEETGEEDKRINKEDKKADKKEIREEFKKIFSKKQKTKPKDKRIKNKSLLNFATERAKVLEKDIDKAFKEWELIFPNIGLSNEIITKIKNRVYKDLGGKDIKIEKIEKRINFSMMDAVNSIIMLVPDITKQIKSKKDPFTILFLGNNQSGKTDSLVKLGKWLQKKNISVLFAATDTSSSEKIAELEKYARQLDIPLTKGDTNSDPSIIASEAKKYAKEQSIKCVLLDTTENDSMTAPDKIRRLIKLIKPDLKIFVGKSTNDDDSLEQAKYFEKEFAVNGIIITKMDESDEKGAIFAISYVLKKPIYFLSLGRDIENMAPFNRDEFLKKLKLG